MPKLLALTDIEELFLWQDRPEFPSSTFVRCQFSGVLLRSELELALKKTLARHPLLRSTVIRQGRTLLWNPAKQPTPELVWSKGATGRGFPSAKPLDIWTEIGLRVFVVGDASKNKCDLIMQFHHSCCDGLGMQEFIHDLLIIYAGLSDDQIPQPSLNSRDYDGLRDRGKVFQRTSSVSRLIFKQLKDIVGVVRFFRHSPKPIVPHEYVSKNSPLPVAYPATCGFDFNRQELGALRAAARRNNVMLNDLLIYEIYCAVAALRNSSSEASGDD